MAMRIVRAAAVFVLTTAACTSVRTGVPTVPPNTDFDVAVGSVARLQDSDVVVRFDTVTEDSRCPQDVTCVWEGNATAIVTLDSAGKTTHAQFATSKPQPVRAFGWAFELRALRPPRTTQTPPGPADYIVTLRVTP